MTNIITTNAGNISVLQPSPRIISELQRLLTFGLVRFPNKINGADYGIAMKCDDQEVFCVKQQLPDTNYENAVSYLQFQHTMICKAYLKYMLLENRGIYISSPYLKQKDENTWETGLAHFIYPDQNSDFDTPVNSINSSVDIYDEKLGIGATNMLTNFINCYKNGMEEEGLTQLTYIGLDYRPRLHLDRIAMYYLLYNNELICLRADLREKEDPTWKFWAAGGLKEVIHMPAIPFGLQKKDLPISKGMHLKSE